MFTVKDAINSVVSEFPLIWFALEDATQGRILTAAQDYESMIYPTRADDRYVFIAKATSTRSHLNLDVSYFLEKVFQTLDDQRKLNKGRMSMSDDTTRQSEARNIVEDLLESNETVSEIMIRRRKKKKKRKDPKLARLAKKRWKDPAFRKKMAKARKKFTKSAAGKKLAKAMGKARSAGRI